MNKSHEAFEKWFNESGQHIGFENVSDAVRHHSLCAEVWSKAWQAAKTEPDAATVALHFGYEVTKIRDQVFIAKNNIGMKLWVPFNRESHPKLFQEYDRCS